ncbi:MAG TPA: hypothetical protein VEB22_05675 [Phycisphaerales bacterium]|nr:hypothetical protein [Phycisphaerales bacterium]
MKRALGISAMVLTVFAVMYVVGFVWPGGGVRRQFGRLSGTRLPAAAKGMTDEQITAETATRAERIRLAVLPYQRERGSLPDSLDALVPGHLSSVPEPLTSTMPFKLLRPSSGGFAIKWEAWPNAAYECYWIDQDGTMAADM